MKQRLGWRAAMALLISLGLLTGCAINNNAPPDSNAGTSPGSSDTDAEPAYEVVMAYMGQESRDLAEVQDKMNGITKAKINATVKLLPIGLGAWGQQSNLMLSSNEKVDLMLTFSGDYNTRVSKGQFIKLDELLKAHGQGIVSAVGQDYLDAVRINGSIHAVPSIRDFASAPGILLRKDLVDKYKIDTAAIKTARDLTAVFQTIKDNEPEVTPLVPLNGLTFVDLMDASSYDALEDRNGVLPMSDNGMKLVNLYETPAYKERLKLVREWYTKGFISKDVATTKDLAKSVIGAGKGFAYFCRIKPGIEAQESASTGKELIAVQLGEPVSQTINITGLMMAIPQNSQNPEKAMQFLNLLYTDSDLLNLLDYGIEGKHYVKKGDLIEYPEGTTVETVGYDNEPIFFGNQFISHVFEGNDPNVWEQVDEFNKGAVKSKALGFTFSIDAVKTESAAVTNVVNQYKLGLETGALDPEITLPKFNEKLKAAGLDQIIAEKQKQLNSWAAARS